MFIIARTAILQDILKNRRANLHTFSKKIMVLTKEQKPFCL